MGICVGKINACTVGVNGRVGEAFAASAYRERLAINSPTHSQMARRLTCATETASLISSRRPRASLPMITKSSQTQSTRNTA